MKKIFARIATVIAIIVFAAFVSTTRPATSSAQSSGSGSGIVGLQGYAWSAFLDSLIPASSDDERKGGVGWVSFS
ncbi:hypothetical protein EB052_02450, partial [bacterium]|nr:hypothetical protein [bacterium]